MRAAAQRRLTPGLVLLAAVLGAIFVALLLGAGQGVRWNPPRATAAPLPPPARGAALPPPQPLQRFAQVWQKPLFSPDRRPAALGDAGAVGDLALTGVILTRNLHIALVHDKSNNRDLQIMEGKSTPDGRWTLVDVHPRSAVFDSPDGRVELKLPAGAPFEKTGAPSDGPPGADEPPPAGDEESPAADGAQARRMGVNPRAAGRAQRARQSQAALQAERIRQLNAVIQKRRAEQADSTQQGVR
ncbi:MAG TPA: hypothetical protein VFW82_02175 [Dyella sp.]|nr:hypothetical protein [Dyella sp.]